MTDSAEKAIRLVLLDDDPLIRATWKMAAREFGHRILVFSDLAQMPESIDLSTEIYVDYCFKMPGDGLGVVEQLSARGYKNIHLTTGWPKDQVTVPPTVRRVIGKDYPAVD